MFSKASKLGFGLIVAAWLLWLGTRGRLSEFLKLAQAEPPSAKVEIKSNSGFWPEVMTKDYWIKRGVLPK